MRPVGSGHSFAPLVPTDGHVVDRLAGIMDHDADTLQFGDLIAVRDGALAGRWGVYHQTG